MGSDIWEKWVRVRENKKKRRKKGEKTHLKRESLFELCARLGRAALGALETLVRHPLQLGELSLLLVHLVEHGHLHLLLAAVGLVQRLLVRLDHLLPPLEKAPEVELSEKFQIGARVDDLGLGVLVHPPSLALLALVPD